MATVSSLRERLAIAVSDPMMVRMRPYQYINAINMAVEDAKSDGWVLPINDDESLAFATADYDYDVPSDFAYIHNLWLETGAATSVFTTWIPWSHWRLAYDGSAPGIRFDEELATELTNGYGIRVEGHKRPSVYTASISAVNEIQSITGDGTGGTFTLSFGGATTSALAYNVSAAAIDTALTALATIVSVTCAGGPIGTAAVTVTFTDPGGANVALITASDTSLTGETAGTVITTTTQGSPAAGSGTTTIDPGLEAFLTARATVHAARYIAALPASEGDVVGRLANVEQSAFGYSAQLSQERSAAFKPNMYSREVPGR
jgi:hypothetical protein